MGGLAFASGPDPLFTPRMPKDVYLEAKARCRDILQSMYEVVESPIEGPGKEDFGDVDMAVFGPKQGTISSDAEALQQIAEALGATRSIFTKVEGVSSHLALPWPETAVDRGAHTDATGQTTTEGLASTAAPTETASADHGVAGDDDNRSRHIQVDVSIFPSLDSLNWMLFKHAHGDLWNLIGSTIRPYGLTVDQQALWLRIPEIEPFNHKRAKVLLTSDHSQILNFIGLSVETYWKGPFESPEAMYEYVAQCRMFWAPPSHDEELPNQESGASADDHGRRALKSNDRRRMNYRPAFRKWIDEFKPECRRQGRFSEQKTTRDEVTAEAIAHFNVSEEYDMRLHEFRVERQRDHIWNVMIKAAIPPADPSNPRSITYRGCLVKALKRVVLEDNQDYGVHLPEDCKCEGGLFDLDKVAAFIETHEDEIGESAYSRQASAYAGKKEKKKK